MAAGEDASAVVLPGPLLPSAVPDTDPGDPRAFHRTMPGYARTRCLRLDSDAVGELWVKDESRRLGLPSFKILGGSWAVHRLLLQLAGLPARHAGLPHLRQAADALRPLTLCTATDGNHGRGVARMARLLDLHAVVFVPDDMSAARREAIASEDAEVVVVDGDYDTAVARAADTGAANGWQVVADVAYTGYDRVPRWVMDGYDTIFAECDDQLGGAPDVVLVQAGVGALAGATINHYRRASADVRFGIVEPLQAACLLESARAGRPVSLASSQGSIMVGLNCGTPSLVAWPLIAAYASVFLAIPDDRAREAMRLLAAAGVEAGESGAAGLAGFLEVLRQPTAREALGLTARSRVLVLNTEGATDPAAYRAIVDTRA